MGGFAAGIHASHPCLYKLLGMMGWPELLNSCDLNRKAFTFVAVGLSLAGLVFPIRRFEFAGMAVFVFLS